MEIVLPIVEILFIAAVVLRLVIASQPMSERAYLTRVLWGAFAIRLTVAALFASFPSLRVFHEDANDYENFCMQLARSWHGETSSYGLPSLYDLMFAHDLPQGAYSFYGVVYYVLGANRLAASAVTSLIGAFSVFLVYRLAGQLFHLAVARRAALLTAVFPSMIIWGSMALKDPLMIALVLVAMHATLQLRRSLRLGPLLELGFALVGITAVRFYIAYFVLGAIATALVFGRAAKLGGKKSVIATLWRQALIGTALVGILGTTGLTSRLAGRGEQFDLEFMSRYRTGMAYGAGSAFATDVDISTPGGAIAFLPIGLAVLLFGPFPWQMTSLRPLLTLPEMLVWWSMIFSLLRGLRFVVRRELINALPLLLFSAGLCTAYALGMGNVGAAFRMRAQVLVLLFIFESVGHWYRICQQRGLDPIMLSLEQGKAAREEWARRAAAAPSRPARATAPVTAPAPAPPPAPPSASSRYA